MQYIENPTKTLMRYFCVLVLFLGAGVQSCTGSNIRVSQSQIVTQTARSAITGVSIIETPNPSIVFTENLSCWTIKPLTKGNSIKGSILFSSRSKDEIEFVWDVSSFQTRRLEYSQDLFSGISPDSTSIVKLLPKENKLLLISSSETKSYSLPDGEYYSATQLPNGLIFIAGTDMFSLMQKYEQGSGFADNNYLLNPATSDLTSVSVFLSDFWMGPLVYRFPIEYSPDLQYVVYKTTPYDNGDYKFILLKIKTNEIIWTGRSMPHWKPDGSALTYFDDGNLFSLSKDGKSTKITQFEQKKLAGMGSLGEEIPWSPDGRYMAFHEIQPALSLFYIWDNQEKVAFRPCLPDELRAYSNYHVYWSFDNNSLLVRLVYPDAEPVGEQLAPTHSLDLILDMTNHIIYTLPDEDNRGQYSSQAPTGAVIKGWTNWEVP